MVFSHSKTHTENDKPSFCLRNMENSRLRYSRLWSDILAYTIRHKIIINATSNNILVALSPHVYSIPKREYYFFFSSAASRFSNSFCFFNISTFPSRTSLKMKNSATSADIPAPTKKEDIRENNPIPPPLTPAVIVVDWFISTTPTIISISFVFV